MYCYKPRTFMLALGEHLWIGLTDVEEEGVWRLITTGDVTDYVYFRSGQPNNWGGREHCVIIRHSLRGWNDKD